MSDASWVFDPVPASGAITGGAADTLVFKPHLASFVREVLQNAHDQRAGLEPVEVDFVFREYSPGSAPRRRLEDALRWSSLASHLRSVAKGDGTFHMRVRQALEDLDDKPLVCLEITDRNTRGLVGGEDERGENFAALCRNVLDTPPGNKPGRGGSYGLGKAVLWLYSSFSTIMLSSRIHADDEDDPNRTRLIGRSVLPYHETGGDRLSGLGWLGADEDGVRAVSLWDGEANEVAARLDIERGHDPRPGTSILLVGFREPYLDHERELEDVARDILNEAQLWFWPAIACDEPSLWVSAAVVRDDVEVFRTGTATEDPTELFATAVKAEEATRVATTAGVVAEREVDLGLPELLEPGDLMAGQHTAKLRLRVVRSQESDHPYANHVALVRGARMVVAYKRWGRSPVDGRPYFAVLEAGLAHGDSDVDHLAEHFLRAAEPPAHDDWALTDAVRARYRPGGGARLRELQGRVSDAISEICADEPPSGTIGPAALSKMFAIPNRHGRDGGGGGVKSPFRMDFRQPELRETGWRLTGTMERASGTGAWHASVKLLLDAESGRADVLPLTGATATTSDGDALPIDVKQESCVVWVEEGVSSVELVLDARVEDPWLARRTRLLVDARPKSGGRPV